jgi:hypothetical protein
MAKKSQTGHVLRLELNQCVYVAVRAKIFAQDRAEKGQFANVMFTAKLSNPGAVNGYWQHLDSS